MRKRGLFGFWVLNNQTRRKLQQRSIALALVFFLIGYFVAPPPANASVGGLAPNTVSNAATFYALGSGAAGVAAAAAVTAFLPYIVVGGVVVYIAADLLMEKPAGKTLDAKKTVKVPEKVKDLVEKIRNNGGNPLPGYEGGKPFSNREKLLPKNTSYREYDVNPKIPGKARDAERIVIGEDGTVWYTNNHYSSFTRVK